MPEPELIQRIRTIFLHERLFVSIPDAARLLGWSREEMEAAIETHDVEAGTMCSGMGIEREEVIAKAREQWPAEVIEDALGRAAERVLPRGLRTRRITARLPRYQADMIEYLAGQQQTTVGHVLSRQLDDLASEHFEKLSSSIPDFAEAFRWPCVEEAEEADFEDDEDCDFGCDRQSVAR
jgi:hypothetical protein